MSKELIKTQMKVKNNLVSVIRVGNVDYISLTDLARYKNPIEPKDVIKNWQRAKTNIEFLALWEQMHNPNLKWVEIDTFKLEAGTHYFTMSPQRWIKETNAIGIISKSGNNGNMRDYANILQLVILSNLENLNSEMIAEGIDQIKMLQIALSFFYIYDRIRKK